VFLVDMKKLWGNQFNKLPSEAVINFTVGSDILYDQRLVPYDVKINQAHVEMLYHQGIITKSKMIKIKKGLSEIIELHNKGKFKLDPQKEDVHTNIESYLTEKYGIEVVGVLHTGKSRNDQVVTDMLLYLKDVNQAFIVELEKLIKVTNKIAKKHENTVMPGFTHHQHATITTFGKVLESLASSIKKDIKGFKSWEDKFNYCPLGAMAAFGTTFNLDKIYTAEKLGFADTVESGIDAITNRGEAEAQLAFNIAQMLNHLAIIAQTLILFSTSEFGFVEIDEIYSTGSSIMPQKKNPDTLELLKAKASYAHGVLISLLGISKAAFTGYNRDSQLTKKLICDLIDESIETPKIVGGVVNTLKVNKEAMLAQANKGFVTATSLMEFMVQEYDLPIRKAKQVVEEAVKLSMNKGLDKIPLEILQESLGKYGLSLKISSDQLSKWQDPSFIFEKLK